jgi:hypothetical protein
MNTVIKYVYFEVLDTVYDCLKCDLKSVKSVLYHNKNALLMSPVELN